MHNVSDAVVVVKLSLPCAICSAMACPVYVESFAMACSDHYRCSPRSMTFSIWPEYSGGPPGQHHVHPRAVAFCWPAYSGGPGQHLSVSSSRDVSLGITTCFSRIVTFDWTARVSPLSLPCSGFVRFNQACNFGQDNPVMKLPRSHPPTEKFFFHQHPFSSPNSDV